MKINGSLLPNNDNDLTWSIRADSTSSTRECIKAFRRRIKTNEHRNTQEERVNKHLSLQVKSKLVWPCCTATSDRHAGGETPNTATETRNKEPRRTSQVHQQRVVNQPGGSPLFPKGSDFSQSSSCTFYCYILLWLGIPALLKWNHLNPVGPAFVIAERFSTGTIGGVLYMLTLDRPHYPCFTCSLPSLFRLCNKESSLLSPTRGVVCTCTIR